MSMVTKNGSNATQTLAQRIIGPLVVASLMGLGMGWLGIRDAVRTHTVQLESLITDQNKGKRFTWDDGQRHERQINLCKRKLDARESREHERIDYLELRIKAVESRM